MNKSPDKVLAVVVTYNPDLTVLGKLITTLNDQGCHVLVVDNCSVNQATLSQYQFPAELILNHENVGLGAAHNQGLSVAIDQAYEYLLILDQDSLPLAGMVHKLCAAHQRLSLVHNVSAVGACYLNSENQSKSFFVKFGALKFKRNYVGDATAIESIASESIHDVAAADFLISSGSLFSVSALQAIGGMDEGLFIDHVDTEWFLRARNSGYKAFGVGSALMQHELGEKTLQFTLANQQRNVPQHKPFRYYYIFRNSILLYKRGYTSWLWKWNDSQRLLMIFVLFGIVKAPRLRNLKMMLLGSWHGLIGKTGKVQLSDS